MNKIGIKFLLTEDKFSLHPRQPRFTYNACGPFTRHCERIQQFIETGNLKHLYKNRLGKACFAQNAAYSDSKDLAKLNNKILRGRAYKIAINGKYDGYQSGLASMICKIYLAKRWIRSKSKCK